MIPYDPNSSSVVIYAKWIVNNQALLYSAMAVVTGLLLSLVSSICAIALKIIPILPKGHIALPLVKAMDAMVIKTPPAPTDAQRAEANPK